MKSPSGYILVKGERFNETFQTEGGFTFFRYLQEGNETKDVNYWGEVISVPNEPKNGISAEIQVGDKAYIHYNTFLRTENYISTLDAWKVAYEDVFCVVRDGEIIPIGGWCLVEPELRKVDTGIFDTKITLEDGTILGEDIILKSETSGTLAHIGTPRKGWTFDPPLIQGDKVAFSDHDAFENTIEGKAYYCMLQTRITGIYDS
jgi:co-chaperonin GroES (HSP10)